MRLLSIDVFNFVTGESGKMTKIVIILLIILLNTAFAAEELTVDCPYTTVQSGTHSPLRVTFSKPMIPFGFPSGLVSMEPTLTPDIAGKWSWSSQSTLHFIPDSPWPNGQRYELKVSKQTESKISGEKLKNSFKCTIYSGSFTARFTTTDSLRLTIDYVNAVFSLPVETDSLRKYISATVPFEISSSNNISFRIRPERGWPSGKRIILTINKGLCPSGGNIPLEKKLSTTFVASDSLICTGLYRNDSLVSPDDSLFLEDRYTLRFNRRLHNDAISDYCLLNKKPYKHWFSGNEICINNLLRTATSCTLSFDAGMPSADSAFLFTDLNFVFKGGYSRIDKLLPLFSIKDVIVKYSSEDSLPDNKLSDKKTVIVKPSMRFEFISDQGISSNKKTSGYIISLTPDGIDTLNGTADSVLYLRNVRLPSDAQCTFIVKAGYRLGDYQLKKDFVVKFKTAVHRYNETCRTVINTWNDRRSCWTWQKPARYTLLSEKPTVPLEIFGKPDIVTAIRTVPSAEFLVTCDSTAFSPHKWHYDTIPSQKLAVDWYTYVPVPLEKTLSSQGRGTAEVLLSVNNSTFDTLGYFKVTDLGVQLLRGRLITAAAVSSLTRRAPVTGAIVSFFDKNRTVLVSGITDTAGLFSVPYQLDVSYVSAIYETDTLIEKVSKTDLIDDCKMAKGSLLTDRNIYRPGDTLYYKGIMRKFADRWIPMTNDSIIITVEWEGTKPFIDNVPLVDCGSFSGKVLIPFDVKRTNFCLTAKPMNLRCEALKKTFSVKEFRMAELTGSVGPGWIAGDSVYFHVSAYWLHGGAAANCPVSLKWSIGRNTYKRSDHFTWPRIEKRTINFSDSDTAKTDSNGTAIIARKRLADDSGATYVLRTIITGSSIHSVEAGNQIEIPAGHYPCIGFFFKENDTEKQLLLKTAKINGAVIQNQKVTIVLNKKEIRKRRIKNRCGLPGVTRDTISTKKYTRSFVSDTSGIICIPVGSLGEGIYEVLASASDLSKPDTFRYNFTIRSSDSDQVPKKELAALSEDKKYSITLVDSCTYTVGDTARIALSSAQDTCTGVLIVRRENIYDYRWFSLTGKDTVAIPLVIRDKFIPSVCVEAVFYPPLWRSADGLSFNQPLGFRTASVTVAVSNASRRIPLSITTDSSSYAPGDSVTVGLSIPTKFASATALVMVVDKGAIQVHDKKIPDINTVFSGEHSDPKQFIIDYSFRCFHGPFNYDSSNALKLRLRKLGRRGVPGIGYGAGYGSGFGMSPGYIDNLIGGLMGGDGGGGLELKRRGGVALRDPIKPCAYFNPGVKFDRTGKATCRFKLPGNLTSWRVMAIVDDTTCFGSDTVSFTTNKPLMIRPQLPRFLRTGDSASAGYILENRTEKELKIFSGIFSSSDTARDSCALVKSSERFCYFPLYGRKPGIDSLLFCVKSDSFSDGIKLPIPTIDEKLRDVQAIGGSTMDNVTIPLVLSELKTASNCSLGILLSTTRMQNLREGIRYLFNYPYGCLEQQCSRIYPILMLQDFAERFNLPVLQNGDEKMEIQKFLNQIGDFQNKVDGGLTYWKSDSSTSYPWLTVYVLEIMNRAKADGYVIDENVYRNAVKYVKSEMNKVIKDKGKSIVDSYTLLVLAQAGEIDWDAMNKLYKIKNELPLSARINLLKAVYISGKNKCYTASLQKSLRRGLIEKGRLAYYLPEESDGFGFCHESPVRQTALALEALLTTGSKSRYDEPMIRWLTEQRKSGRWRTTQENMAVFRAFSAYTSIYEKDEPVFDTDVKFDGTDWFTATIKGREGVSEYRSRQINSNGLPKETKLLINKSGSGRLYYDLFLSKSLPYNTPAVSSGLTITRNVKPLYNTINSTFDQTKLKIGACVKVTVVIRCDQDITFTAINDPIPAGCEAVDPELFSGEQVLAREITGSIGPARPSHYEFRDSRVLFFFNEMPAGEYQLTYCLKPIVAGKFNWPAPSAEAMYYPEISGRGASGVVSITK